MPLPGGTSNQRSAWPKGWQNVKLAWCSTTLGVQMSLSGGMSELTSTGHKLVPLIASRCCYHGGTSYLRSAWPKGWPNVKLTWCGISLGHQMPLPGGMSELRSTGPKLVALLAMRYLYWGYIWLKYKMDIWKFEHTLCFMLCFTEIFSTKEQSAGALQTNMQYWEPSEWK